MAGQERRVDPIDGSAYSYQEIADFYRGKFKHSDIKDYWEKECKPVQAKGKGRGKTKADAQQQPQQPEAAGGKAAAARALAKTMASRSKDWHIGGVVYQVFVDRFAPPDDLAAKKALYPEPCTLHEWSEAPRRGDQNKETGYWAHELQFWGGDLPSLTGKLDYLKELDVDVVYLQPVCTGFSNHKYDATDYNDLEPQYGTLDDFKVLVDRLHGQKMKLVLDGVFNHMGKRSADVQEALSDEKSKKRNWFYLGDHYPTGFKTWGCADNLVELKLETKTLQEHIWSGPKSVVATWLKRGADGWRLDVAQEIGFDYLREITEAAHQAKRNSLVVGEVWAYPSRWTECMDGVLNLHMGVVIYGAVSGDFPGPSAAQSIAGLIEDSSMEEVLRSWIVVSNHDMPRLAEKLPSLTARKMAQVLQFTLPGCPLIYYGDELGMNGGDDPDNRATIQWEKVTEDNEMLAHTKKLIAMRRRLRALRIGDFQALRSQRLLGFARVTERVKDTVVVLANGSIEPVQEMVTIPDTRILGYTLFRDEITGEETRILGATLTCRLEPKSVRVFAMVDESDNPSGAQYKRIYGHWATMARIPP